MPARSAPEASSAFGTLRGRVIDAVTREPVRAFDVTFHGTRAYPEGSATPGSRKFRTNDGRFEWQYLPPGLWTVTTDAPGYQRLILSELQIAGGVATAEMTLPLRAGYRVRGRIYEEDSGTAIAGASITYRERNTEHDAPGRAWGLRAHANSEPDGSFALDGVPAGRMTLEVDAGTYARRTVEVIVSSDMAPVEIAIAAGGRIAGRIVAADGVSPASGVATLMQSQGGGWSGMGRGTGVAGEFSFEYLVPGRYRLTGRTQNGSVFHDIVLARNQRMEGIILVVREGHSIRGTVRGLRSEELEKLIIRAVQEDDIGADRDSQVDPQGAYALHGMLPGRVHVMAEADSRELSKRVEMADADITLDLEFPSGSRLSGRVTRDGKPWAGTPIAVTPLKDRGLSFESTTTSPDGIYLIRDLPDGEYHVWAHTYRKRILVAGDTVIDIDVPLAQLAGRVLEAEGGLPIAGAEVSVWPAEPGTGLIRLQEKSAQSGTFAFVGLEPGDYFLMAYKPGYAMHRVRISYAAPVTDLAIPLPKREGVQVRVRPAEKGGALSWVFMIEKAGDRPGARLRVELDENGLGHIPGALAGSTLVFSSQGFAPVVVPAWGGQPLELELRRP